MIKLQVIGNLGKDCIVNTVNGKNVINFTVAHTEKYRDSQGNNQGKDHKNRDTDPSDEGPSDRYGGEPRPGPGLPGR